MVDCFALVRFFRKFLIVLLFIINPITGLVIGLISIGGGFVSWKSLGNPPEFPVEIMAADVREVGVYVKTDSGQVYECCFGENFLSWAKREKIEIYDSNFPDCLMGREDEGMHIRDEVDNYPVYWCGEWDSGRAYYSIRKDGSVWVWKYSSDSIDLLAQICGYPFIGLILYLLIVAMLNLFRAPKLPS